MGLLVLTSFIFVTLFFVIVETKWLKFNFQKQLLLFIVVFSVCLIFMFRDGVLLSTDYENYKLMYTTFPSSYGYDAIRRIEPLFGGLIYIINVAGLSADIFIGIVSAVQFSIIYIFIGKSKAKYPVAFFLFLISSSFFYNFGANTIRQGLALSFILLALLTRSKIKISMFMFIAVLVHYSAVILLPIVFLAPMIMQKLSRSRIIAISLLFLSVFMFLLDFSWILGAISNLVSGEDVFSRLEGNLSAGESVVSGRLYYVVSFFLMLFIMFYHRTIVFLLEEKSLFDTHIFNSIVFILFCCVLFYPILYNVGVFVRVFSYGFVFILPLISVVGCAFLNKRDSLLFSSILFSTSILGLNYILDFILI